MSNKLAIIEKEAVEELDQLKGRIVDYDREFHSAFQRQMGFAFLAGVALLRAKEIVPHGKFMEWRERELEVKRASAERYMKFTEALQSKFPTVGNLKEVRLLGEGEALTEEQLERINDAVHELADGKTLTEMYRDLGVIRQPKKQQHHPRKISEAELAEAERDAANEFGERMCANADLLLDEEDETLSLMDHKIRARLRELHIDLGKKIDAMSRKKGAGK